jgi:2-octaprenyl-6-methoxyphenol hydroxylase
MYHGRIALLGDAAHAIHPIAGQGLNLGLKDAAALAEVIIEAARLGEDIGSELVLERYAKWRRFENVTTSMATDAFVHLFSNNNPILRPLRNVGMGLINKVAPARRFFMEDAGGATGDLPKLLRGQMI